VECKSGPQRDEASTGAGAVERVLTSPLGFACDRNGCLPSLYAQNCQAVAELAN